MMSYFIMKSESIFNNKTLLESSKHRVLSQLDNFSSEIAVSRKKLANIFNEIREILNFKEKDYENQFEHLYTSESDTLFSDINAINREIEEIDEINEILHFILQTHNKTYLSSLMLILSKIEHISDNSIKKPAILTSKPEIDMISFDALKNMLLKTNFLTSATIDNSIKLSARKNERSSTPRTNQYKSLINVLESARNYENNGNSAKNRKNNNFSQNSMSNLEDVPFCEEIGNNATFVNNEILRNRNVSPFRSKFIYIY